jgi:hypothetical protein
MWLDIGKRIRSFKIVLASLVMYNKSADVD